jgi:diguanylate cyclase (GGDEF)-like protein/PAS domain S-box-containing protein
MSMVEKAASARGATRGEALANAQSFDARTLGTLYGRLQSMETTLGPKLDSMATAAERRAMDDIVGSFLCGGLLLVLIVVGFERLRSHRVALEAEQGALRASEERFRALVQNGSDIITVVAPDGTVLYKAPSVTSALGHHPCLVEGSNMGVIVHPDDLPRFRALCASGNHAGEGLRLSHADGTWRDCEARATPLTDRAGVVLNIRDISEHKALERELRYQAFHDSLTGLANRALFSDRVEHALARQRRGGEPLAVLLVDLDDFKSTNDTLGHGAGDRLLAEVATRLRGAVRAPDTVARLGGDEFVVLVEDPAHGSPESVAERILEAFRPPIVLERQRLVVVSASIGVAVATPGTVNANELLRDADVAMYVAKAEGKGRWVRFEPRMYRAVQARMELKTDLLAALAAGDQMELFYQPMVNLASGETIGVEALVRWRHRERGLVLPLDFLPVAEDTGLIIPLGRWVLRQALSQLAAWRRCHPTLSGLTVNVNVSGHQLKDPSFVGEVVEALAANELAPSALMLEITETVLVGETPKVVEALGSLRALGVKLAIDDFGTGYSSLGYLQRFPVDVLKIDTSFVAGLGGGSLEAALAETVVDLGSTLGMQTVAEGVELEEQVEELLALGCAYGQGYLFAKPLPAADCEALLLIEAKGAGRSSPDQDVGPGRLSASAPLGPHHRALAL